MIQASPAFLAANANPNKVPVFLIKIADYSRAFSNVALDSVPGISSSPPVVQQASFLADFGGLEEFPSRVALASPVTPGNVLLAFAFTNGLGLDPGTPISDSAGNTWTLLYSTSKISVFSAIANASTGQDVVSFTGVGDPTGIIDGGNFELFVVEVPSYLSGFTSSGSGNRLSIDFANFGSLDFFVINEFPSLQAGANLLMGGAGSEVATLSPGAVSVFPWLVSQGDISIAVNELDGAADQQGYGFNVQDHEELLTGDFPGFVFEGKKIVLLHGFVGMQTDDYVPLFTGTIDTVFCDNVNLEYTFSCVDAMQKELAKSIFAVADDGSATDNDHPRTIEGHPIDILLRILQVELGLAAARITLAKIQSFRDTVLAGAWFYMQVTSPPAAKDFIEAELMKPLGGYLWTNNLGQVTVNFMYPLSLTPAMAINTDTLIEVPLEKQADLVNQVETRFDYDADDKPFADSLNIEGNSLSRYGPSPLHVIESRGMRSGFQGFYWSSVLAELIFLRFASKNAQFESVMNIWSPAILAEPGDLIALTCPYCPDRDRGVKGVTGMLFEVADKTCQLQTLNVGLNLLKVNFAAFKQSLIAPNSMPDFTGATSEQKGTYMFQANDSDRYSDGSPANTLT